MDRAIADGKLDRSRPFTRRDAVAALKGQLPISQQSAAVREIYTANVYPGHEHHLEHLSEQHRSHGVPRVLPLSRRPAQDEKRESPSPKTAPPAMSPLLSRSRIRRS